MAVPAITGGGDSFKAVAEQKRSGRITTGALSSINYTNGYRIDDYAHPARGDDCATRCFYSLILFVGRPAKLSSGNPFLFVPGRLLVLISLSS